LTGDDLAALTEKAKEMGEKTKFSASDAADGFEYMAMAGVEGGGCNQEEGNPAVEILPGTVIHIPANLKHWPGSNVTLEI